MKTATRSPSSNATTSHRLIPADRLTTNPWNPNRMTADMYGKAIESITLYGFIDPLTVWPHPEKTGYWQIIDGEHRYRAGGDLNMTEFPCTVVDGLTRDQAKKLTIVLNELHGQADPGKMGDLLNDLLSLTSMDELIKGLPYSPDILAGFLGVPELPPLGPTGTPVPEVGATKEPWVERLYRMPKSVALIIDEALEKAKDGEELDSWQALERVAADYLAS